VPRPAKWVEGSPTAAASIELNASSVSATAGTSISLPPRVIVKNYAGTPLSGVTVTFSNVTGGGSITGGTVVTNASGIASLTSWTLGSTPGANTLTATLTGVGVILFTVTGN